MKIALLVFLVPVGLLLLTINPSLGLALLVSAAAAWTFMPSE